MGNLVLNSLEIKGFRGFSHLQIEHLGRVNLIVGKNNIGKSSLLEALQLYARGRSPTLIWELLRARDESRYSSGTPLGRAITRRYVDVNALHAQYLVAWIRKLFDLESV